MLLGSVIGGTQAQGYQDYAKAVAQQQQAYNAPPAPPKDVALALILDRLSIYADRINNIAYRTGALADRAFGPVPTAATGQLNSGMPDSLLGKIESMMSRINSELDEAQSNIERCERLA